MTEWLAKLGVRFSCILCNREDNATPTKYDDILFD